MRTKAQLCNCCINICALYVISIISTLIRLLDFGAIYPLLTCLLTYLLTYLDVLRMVKLGNKSNGFKYS